MEALIGLKQKYKLDKQTLDKQKHVTSIIKANHNDYWWKENCTITWVVQVTVVSVLFSLNCYININVLMLQITVAKNSRSRIL